MVKADAIEGIVNDRFRFHYDIFADVLYIRLLGTDAVSTVGELTDEGDILLRDEKTDNAVGRTVVSWWKRFGDGMLPDSIAQIQRQVEQTARKMAA